ncbi:Uncharacterised protein [Mycobacteroides abscessus subsp. abscessus]|nr:Uncharacterised protein [Mycobacteroides abscessus subsp. abscessus]
MNHSHAAISQANHDGRQIASTVVTIEPMYTTNMTGLRAWSRGLSFRSACGTDVMS